MSMKVDKNKQDEVLSNTDEYFKGDEMTLEEDLGKQKSWMMRLSLRLARTTFSKMP